MNKKDLINTLQKMVDEHQEYFVTQERISALIETFEYSFTPEHERINELEKLMRRFKKKTRHEDYPDVITRHKEIELFLINFPQSG